MSHCAFCSLDAYNVIEVRYARSMPKDTTGLAAKEFVGRGYGVCDGCLKLLDYQLEHHVNPQRISFFNLASSIYQGVGVWTVVALSALANTGSREGNLLLRGDFQGLGLLLFSLGAIVYLLRGQILFGYLKTWKSARQKPIRPRNSLAGFTTLRDRVNPELGAYLPVRFSDSQQSLAQEGALPLRCIGPGGEPWGAGPETNFPGRGANGWYRLVWVSWLVWPLTEVLRPSDAEWQPFPEPAVSSLEAGGAGLFSALAFAVFAIATSLHISVAFGAGLLSWPVGFYAGRLCRELWKDHKLAETIRPI